MREKKNENVVIGNNKEIRRKKDGIKLAKEDEDRMMMDKEDQTELIERRNKGERERKKVMRKRAVKQIHSVINLLSGR
jgi:hypothetical protein